jgi:hypothetical protein
MRYTTKGISNVDNCHPFDIWKSDDKHIILMHNGTMTDFGDSTVSDTRDYVESILKPMAEMYHYGDITESFLDNPLFERIQKKFGTGWSKFLFADNEGNFKIFGEDKDCVKEEGFWASNSYSFDTPKSVSVNTYVPHGNSRYYTEWKEAATPKKEEKVAALPKVSEAVENLKETFIERWGKDYQLEDVLYSLSEEDISELVESYPEEATMLIRDLIYLVYGGGEEDTIENIKRVG